MLVSRCLSILSIYCMGIYLSSGFETTLMTKFSTANQCLVGTSMPAHGRSKTACLFLCVADNACEGLLYNQSKETCVVCTELGIPGPAPYSGIPVLRPADRDECNVYLLDDIPDSHLTASSEASFAYSHGPERARLSSIERYSSALIGAWMPDFHTDTDPYIQAKFYSMKEVMKIVTKGRNTVNAQHVKSYMVSYSVDCSTFSFVKDANDVTMVFSANYDADTAVIRELPQSLLALCIRLHPVTWGTHPSLRFDILGCDNQFPHP